MAKTAKTVQRRTAKAWHVLNFEQRFELPEDMRKCRKGALLFLKYVVSPSDDESINLAEQLASLRCMASEDMPEILLEGCFWRLAKMAANRSRVYRGYLLDERYQPATAGKIAMWLGLGADLTAGVLEGLEKAGLIERVPLPEFVDDGDDPGSTPPAADEPPAGREKPTRKKTAAKGSKAARKKNSAQGRKFPDTFKKGEDESEVNPQPSASGKGEKKTEDQPSAAEGQGPAARAAEAKGQAQGQGAAIAAQAGPNQREAESEAEAEPEQQAGREVQQKRNGQRESQPQGYAPSSPTTAPLNLTGDLTGTDGGGAGNKTAPNINIVSYLDELYDRTGYIFADRVFRAIGVPHSQDSPAGRSEIEAFASAWQRALRSGRKPTELNELFDKSIKRAEFFGRQRARGKRYRNGPEAVWMYEFNQRLAGHNPFKNGKKAGT
ncbi:MAG: hypothetical protein LLF76_03170 [Planctomycetaceae bacterium]|nr:hypothetical protein [Planctomycetaceae bacterium]